MEQTPFPQTSPPLIPENKSSKISKKKLLIIVILLFILAIVIGLAFYFYKGSVSKNPKTTSEDSLLEQPLYDFSGNIEEINGQTLTVTDTQYSSQQPKKTTYKVRVNDQTDIKWEPLSVPYSLKIATPSAAQAKSGDLKIGQRVQVRVKEDIRKNGRGELTANSITISHGLVVINGTINSFQDNKLELRAKPPSVPEEKDYQFKLDSETEITSFADQKKLPLSELKKDIDVIIYSDKDVNLFVDLKALKISVMIRP